MKKLYSLLLVGLVASLQMEARDKSGDAALRSADTETLIGRIGAVEDRISQSNYADSRAYQLKDLANDAEAALYPETAKEEALKSLRKTKKALRNKKVS